MTTTDAEFLAEVEHFLTSCDLPLLTSLETSMAFISDEHERSIENPCTKRQSEELGKMDTASRHELAKAKDRKRRRAYRERRRTERDNLQQEIKRLTEELQKTEGEAKQTSIMFSSSWKMIAQHQLAARKGAEIHQTQLYRATTFSQHKKIRFGTTGTEIFAAYIKELDAVYAQTDKTLQPWRLESTDANWDAPSETWDEDPHTGYFQFRGKITMPFDFRDICRSRWQIVHLLHLQDCREIYDAVDSPENTVALKVRRTTCLTSGGIASVLRRLVIRRYEADGRMVLVWRVFTEGEGFFTGMHADETGWGVTTAVEGSSKTGTVLRTCVHNAPMNFSNVTARNHVVKQFGDQLLEWGR
ncbi:hypothetical protein PC121_g19108 [Phytophthora cactorum]|nr:hypothetical protein PC120_g21009 [Phytophthora cactorum]KAG3049074.1 hypothetical protein PC121_g19108 [Phytophthora cactorum]